MKKLGHDVKKIGIDEPAGINDSMVIDIARKEERILFTRDCGDMGELIFRKYVKIPGVVCIRGNIRGKAEVSAFVYLMDSVKNIQNRFITLGRVSEGFYIRIRNIQ
ncbi:DUF5615 family PIN-like protein [Persephonella sp.]